MKRIKLYAYWAQNLGDDLMVHILLKRYPHYQFYCESWNPYSGMFNTYPNFLNEEKIQRKYGRLNHLVNILTLNQKKDFLMESARRKLNKCDCSVFIGGSLYQQGSSEDFTGWLQYEEKKLEKSPLFVIGANFGPYVTDEFKNAFAAYFQRCGGVTFREKASCELFPDNEKIAYAPDVVFNLEVPSNVENNQTVLISVINVAERENLRTWANIYFLRIARICELCIKEGKTPVLMSFCKTEGDDIAIQQILNQLPEKKRHYTKTFLYNGNIDAALELYRVADRVIATRFHAMILALKFGKPFYSISYNQKIRHVLQDMGLNCYCEMKDIERISEEEMLNECRKTDVQEYVKQAEQQFAQLNKYLGDVK